LGAGFGAVFLAERGLGCADFDCSPVIVAPFLKWPSGVGNGDGGKDPKTKDPVLDDAVDLGEAGTSTAV
jgi:hypothetical protein